MDYSPTIEAQKGKSDEQNLVWTIRQYQLLQKTSPDFELVKTSPVDAVAAAHKLTLKLSKVL